MGNALKCLLALCVRCPTPWACVGVRLGEASAPGASVTQLRSCRLLGKETPLASTVPPCVAGTGVGGWRQGWCETLAALSSLLPFAGPGIPARSK